MARKKKRLSERDLSKLNREDIPNVTAKAFDKAMTEENYEEADRLLGFIKTEYGWPKK